MAVTIEQVLDKLADKIITSPVVDQQLVLDNQKTIRNGIISLGRSNADKLILFEKDVKANKEDLETSVDNGLGETFSLENLADILTESFDFIIIEQAEGFTIQVDDEGCIHDGLDITTLFSDGDLNPINISQFVNIDLVTSNVVPGQANEFLDTNIYELLGGGRTRQDRINDFFIEFQNLTADPPDFEITNGMVGIDFSSDDYSDLYDISPTNPEGNIPRLDIDEGEENVGQTLQSLRDTLDTYLVDIDEELDGLEDQRPTYRNESAGYLKFRNLNQGIIVRNTNQEFIEGLNPDTKDYLTTGFTITMWVRFLDKVSEGTLFNFGNPTRTEGAFGFRLETYVLNKDDACPNEHHETWNDAANNIGVDYFTDSDSARFVRLLIDDGGTLRDSHVGMPNASKIANTALNDGVLTYPQYDLNRESTLIQNPHIPENFSEWYFICASFNPIVTEDVSAAPGSSYLNNADYWRNNVESDGAYTNFSELGNRCKVEIISRTDLLLARGYKV